MVVGRTLVDASSWSAGVNPNSVALADTTLPGEVFQALQDRLEDIVTGSHPYLVCYFGTFSIDMNMCSRGTCHRLYYISPA